MKKTFFFLIFILFSIFPSFSFSDFNFSHHLESPLKESRELYQQLKRGELKCEDLKD